MQANPYKSIVLFFRMHNTAKEYKVELQAKYFFNVSVSIQEALL